MVETTERYSSSPGDKAQSAPGTGKVSERLSRLRSARV